MPGAIPGVSDAVDVRLGSHNACVLTRDGGAACWGPLDTGIVLPGVDPSFHLEPVDIDWRH